VLPAGLSGAAAAAAWKAALPNVSTARTTTMRTCLRTLTPASYALVEVPVRRLA